MTLAVIIVRTTASLTGTVSQVRLVGSGVIGSVGDDDSKKKSIFKKLDIRGFVKEITCLLTKLDPDRHVF